MSNQENQFMEHLQSLTRFVQSKVGNPEITADLVQESYLKALKNSDQLKDEDKLLPWLMMIARNTVYDYYRQRSREQKVLAESSQEPSLDSEEDEAELCACYEPIIEGLKPEYREVLKRLDLGSEKPAGLARELKITVGSLKVRRHRARQKLRSQMESVCGMCATHGCLNCTCGN